MHTFFWQLSACEECIICVYKQEVKLEQMLNGYIDDIENKAVIFDQTRKFSRL